MDLQFVFCGLDAINKLLADSPCALFSSDEEIEYFRNPAPLLQSVCSDIIDTLNSNLHDVRWWKCLRSILELLLMAEDLLSHETLISVSHSSSLKKACHDLMCLGVLPCLSFRIPPWSTLPPSLFQIPQKDKDLCVEAVMLTVVRLRLNSFLVEAFSKELGPLIAGSLHLVFASPPRDFKAFLTSLLDDSYQPQVFTQLMLLNSALGKEGKMSRVVRRILLQKVEAGQGVETLIAASLSSDSPTSDVIKISQLLASKHNSHFYQSVLPQLLPLLTHKEEKMRQVSANCFPLVYEKDKESFQRLLVEPVVAPLLREAGEEAVEECLRRLEALVGCCERGRVPWALLEQAVPPLAIALTASQVSGLRPIVTSLVKACLDQAPAHLLSDVILKFVFPKATGAAFRPGSSGKLVTYSCTDPPVWKPELFLALLSGKEKAQLFQSLVSVVSKGTVEQRMISAELLSSLSSEREVLTSLSSEPAPLISFLSDLLSDPQVDSDSLLLGLALLNVIIEDKLMHRKRNWKLFDQLIEPLQKLKTESTNAEIRILSDEIYSALLSRGIIRLNVEEDEPEQAVDVSDYEKAMEEIKDPHLPVRAHAVRHLSKLIASKSKVASRNRHTILALLKENLKDEDSYMYLSCIEGLSSIAAEFPNEVLKTLCDQYAHCKDIKLRLKVGESLMKTTRNLGEMAFPHKRELLNTMLNGVRDKDHLVRASSLSNIGELCKILSFRITNDIMEIFNCIQAVFHSDKYLEPKRAAVLVVTLLFKGLGSDIFTVLEPILLDLYRKLKIIYETENDEITKLHAQIALEELRSSTVNFLFPVETLKKNIFVRDSTL